jgi:hypothetical protein
MFDPTAHLMKIARKVKNPATGQWETRQDDYLEVKWRLVWFRDRYPHGQVETEEICVDLDRGYARYKARVTDGEGGSATGHGTETKADFADYCERAETRALGRALAAIGIGTQFVGQELSEGEHIADAGVDQNAPVAHAEKMPSGTRSTGSGQHKEPAKSIRPTPTSERGNSSPNVSAKEVEEPRPTTAQIDALLHLLTEAYTEEEHGISIVGQKLREVLGRTPEQKLTKRDIHAELTQAQHDQLKADAEQYIREQIALRNPIEHDDDDVPTVAGPEPDASQEPQAATKEPTEWYSGSEQNTVSVEAASRPDADAATESQAMTPAPESGESDVGKFASAKQIGALKFMAQQLGNDAYADVQDMEQHWPQGIPISVYERVKARLDERKKTRKAGAQATTEV